MKKKSILIIDNELFILKKAHNILGDEKLPVETASSLSQAQKQFSSSDIGLIIFSPPAIDCQEKEFMQKIRNYKHLKNIPIMVMLNDNEINKAADLLKIGVSDYILKPFRPKELISRVLTLLRRKFEPVSPSPSNILYRGELEDISLAEIIKICEINNFSGILKIKDNEKNYSLELRLGNITSIKDPTSKPDEALDNILSLRQGSLQIEQEPPAFWRAKKSNLESKMESSLKQIPHPSEELPPSNEDVKESNRLPMGRISSLNINGRQFQIQTEVHTGAKPLITTLIICEGQILKKIGRKWTPLTSQVDKVTKEQDKINEHHDTIVTSIRKLLPITSEPAEFAAEVLLNAVKMLANLGQQAVGRNICFYYLKRTHSSLLKKYPGLSSFFIDEEGEVSLMTFDKSQMEAIKSGAYQWFSALGKKFSPLSPLFKAKSLRDLTKSLEFQLDWIDFYLPENN